MATRLVWARVMRPRTPLVYLDINHYIYLARAKQGTGSPGYAALLDACRSAVIDGRALFVLSGQHLREMTAIGDPARRQAVAEVMEELTGFNYLLGRPEIAHLELEAGLDDVFGDKPSAQSLPLVRGTFAHAFGMIGGFNILDADGRDARDALRTELGAHEFENRLAVMNLEAERSILRGPSDAEQAVMRATYGYAPETAQASQRSRLEFELDLRDQLNRDPRQRLSRLRDFVSGRELAHEWLDRLNEVNTDRARQGKQPLDIADAPSARRLASAMPQHQVAISIKTHYHRNPNHGWTTNDIVDIDALSVAYTYCEAVYTDKAARAALAESKELRAIPTFVPRRPAELTDWLNALPVTPISDLWVPHPLSATAPQDAS